MLPICVWISAWVSVILLSCASYLTCLSVIAVLTLTSSSAIALVFAAIS